MKTLFKLSKYPPMLDEKVFPEEILQEGYKTGSIETSNSYIHCPHTLPGSGRRLGFYEWICFYNLRVA